ncbi:hypothetical protein V6N13_092735 [Hibiscus sabdariffa]
MDKPILTCMETIKSLMMQMIVKRMVATDRPKDYVNGCYTKNKELEIYNHFISLIKGPNQWSPVLDMEPILSPQLRRPPGRPHNVRKKEADETLVFDKFTCAKQLMTPSTQQPQMEKLTIKRKLPPTELPPPTAHCMVDVNT